MGHKIGYARVSTTDQDPQLQLDALARENCLKVFTDTATGTKTDRPQWTLCLADLRPGDTLVIWKIDRLGRNLRERTQAGLAAARKRGRTGGRKLKMTPELINKAQRMYDAKQFTMKETADTCDVTPMTIYRHIRTSNPDAEIP